MNQVEYEGIEVKNGHWEVRPKGQTGIGGFNPVKWRVCRVMARSAAEALDKAGRSDGRIKTPHSIYPMGVTRAPREITTFTGGNAKGKSVWGYCKPKNPIIDDRPPDSAA